MTILVNGRPIEFKEGETLTDLMGRMNYVFPLVIVRIGGDVIAKSAYDSTIVPDGTVVEVIHLTSGG